MNKAEMKLEEDKITDRLLLEAEDEWERQFIIDIRQRYCVDVPDDFIGEIIKKCMEKISNQNIQQKEDKD